MAFRSAATNHFVSGSTSVCKSSSCSATCLPTASSYNNSLLINGGGRQPAGAFVIKSGAKPSNYVRTGRRRGGSVSHTIVAATTAIVTDPIIRLTNWDSHQIKSAGLLLQLADEDVEGQKLQFNIDGRRNTVAASPPTDDQLEQSLFLEAELRLLANAASDRAEMHGILALQRDNWNKLFQRTLTAASLSACLLSALTDRSMALCPLSLAVPALMLNAGTAGMMAVINQFQPSQLAEEQRTAVRLFSKVASDIEYALKVAPELRQHPPSFLRDCRRRLAALDKAFPMPLTPGGLEKFPAKVVPPVLIEPVSRTSCSKTGNSIHIEAAVEDIDSAVNIAANGWDAEIIHDLQHVAELLRRSDISKYTGWAQNLVKINKCLAVAAPVLAACAAVLNGALIVAGQINAPAHNMGMWAAICSVLAVFASSLSHDMQMGMVYELYRNSAGYYANVESSIAEMLDAPVQERENGFLFRQRVAYQLGRLQACGPHHPILREDAEEAGTLF